MFNDRQPRVRRAFDPLQQRWVEELPDIQRKAVELIQAGHTQGCKVLSEFTEQCARQALETCTKLIAEFEAEMLTGFQARGDEAPDQVGPVSPESATVARKVSWNTAR
jgi:hypothetical protein